MQRQGSFSQAEYAGKKKQTRRDKFLAEMEVVVPWARLVERLRPFYPKGERGRPPIGLERMLRVHFLQQWYGLADGAIEDTLYDTCGYVTAACCLCVLIRARARRGCSMRTSAPSPFSRERARAASTTTWTDIVSGRGGNWEQAGRVTGRVG